MTLTETFENVFSAQDFEVWDAKCEKIADKFAIGFAEWVIDGNIKGFEMHPNKLLEIYKKEQGL
jgi:hypothetical protein